MKKNLLFVIGILCSVMLHAQTWQPEGMQGEGSVNRPWQIRTSEHLAALAQYVNAGHGDLTKGKHYRMMNDIDLTAFLADSAAGWLPIGINGNSFQGVLHGAGHVISGLRINRPALGDCGLFGSINAASMDSLGVEVAENDSIVGQDATGILAGRAGNFSTLSQCYVKGNVSGGANVGGLVGRFNNSWMENCYAVVNVKGTHPVWTFAGGLVGFNYNDTDQMTGLRYSYAAGTVKSAGDYAGGLVGYGRNVQKNTNDYIQNCVAANTEVNGHWVGKIGYAYAETCYASENMLTSDSVGINGNSMIYSELCKWQFYTDTDNWQDAAWNFDEVWMMYAENRLPVLRWQNKHVEKTEPVVTVNGIILQNIKNQYIADILCDVDFAEVVIDAGLAKVLINNTEQYIYNWNLRDYGDNYRQFALIWQPGDTATYTIKANKPIPFDQVVKVFWNNTLTVINNPEHNGGYTFTSYKWYRNQNLISTEQWWSAGANGEWLNPEDRYKVELTTLAVDGILRSCENSIILKVNDFYAYPNPVSKGGILYLETDLNNEQLKDAVIEIYDYNGKLVEILPASSQTSFNMKYSKGIYMFMLKSKNGFSKTLKILVH